MINSEWNNYFASMKGNQFCHSKLWNILRKLYNDNAEKLKFFDDLFRINYKYLGLFLDELPQINNQQVDLLDMFQNFIDNGGFFGIYQLQQFDNQTIGTCNKKQNASLNTYGLPEQLAKMLLANIYTKNLLLFEQMYLRQGKVNKNLIQFILSFNEIQASEARTLLPKGVVSFNTSCSVPLMNQKYIKNVRQFQYENLEFTAIPVLQSETCGFPNQLGCNQAFKQTFNIDYVHQVALEFKKQFEQFIRNDQSQNDYKNALQCLIELQNILFINANSFISSQLAVQNIFDCIYALNQDNVLKMEQITVCIVQMLQLIINRLEFKQTNTDISLFLNGLHQLKIQIVPLLQILSQSPDLIEIKIRFIASLINQKPENSQVIKRILTRKEFEECGQLIVSIFDDFRQQIPVDSRFLYSTQCALVIVRCGLSFLSIDEGICAAAMQVLQDVRKIQIDASLVINRERDKYTKAYEKPQHEVSQFEQWFEGCDAICKGVESIYNDLKATDLYDLE